MRKKQKKAAVSSSSAAISVEDLRGALDGLRVYVIHCKDGSDADDTPMREVIVAQVRALVEAKGLGAEILAAEQGMRIGALNNSSTLAQLFILNRRLRRQRYEFSRPFLYPNYLFLETTSPRHTTPRQSHVCLVFG